MLRWMVGVGRCKVFKKEETRRQTGSERSEESSSGSSGGEELAEEKVGDEETEEGVTLETLPLLPGYWRNSPQSLDIRTCSDNIFNGTAPGCRGGKGEPCKDWLTGPLCTQCNVSSGRFYDGDRFECNKRQHKSTEKLAPPRGI